MELSRGVEMKHIFDSDFKYKPSYDTNVRKTFDRVRKQQKPKKEVSTKVTTLRRVPAAGR